MIGKCALFVTVQWNVYARAGMKYTTKCIKGWQYQEF